VTRQQWLNALYLSCAITVLALLPLKALSQTSGTCLTEPIDSSPRSVTIIRRSHIEQQSALIRNMGKILSQLVPGLSASPGSRRGLSLRGRRVGVLIDGVPLVESGAELRSLTPGTIERIEVIRGSSPICKPSLITG